jgi:SAM-dependent methyltransferase
MSDDRATGSDGLEPDQEELLAALRAAGFAGRTVLEIGCGDGDLHHQLLDEGATAVTAIEFSAERLETAMATAQARGHTERVRYLEGDFVRLAGDIEPADVTVLDKVVHCYQEPEALVRESTARTRHVYGLTFPRKIWWLRLFIKLGGPLVRLFIGEGWSPRYTDPEVIRGWIETAGFERMSHTKTGVMQTEVWVRRAGAADPGERGTGDGEETTT